jgi:hypothetical protein
MMTASAARLLGVSVSQTVPLGFYLKTQMNLPGFGTPRVPPALRVNAVLVGIVTLDNQVVQDDIDRAYGFTIVTPALVREAVALSPGVAASEGYGVQLDRGSSDVASVEQQIIREVPPHMTQLPRDLACH